MEIYCVSDTRDTPQVHVSAFAERKRVVFDTDHINPEELEVESGGMIFVK